MLRRKPVPRESAGQLPPPGENEMAKKTYAQLERAEEKIEDQKKKMKKAEMVMTIQKAVRSAVRQPAKKGKR